MKRIMIAMVLLLSLLCACAPIPSGDEPAVLSLRYRDVDLTVGMAAETVIAQLGDDYTMTEAESCAGQGQDRMYTYPSVRLYVFVPVDGEAVVSSVSYTDDGVQTADGLHVGSSSSDVVSALGKADETSDARLIYRGKGAVLTFGLRDGVVVSMVLAGE
ncbi:MAG: hypothetical protein E7625_08010 [Ruminococcaceae bacterium]|nr:hypothetical protein [Oscillospiraceae bacterium]